MSHTQVITARERLVRSVLRLVSSERDEPHAFFAAELEYCQEQVDQAAAQLTAALLEDTEDGRTRDEEVTS